MENLELTRIGRSILESARQRWLHPEEIFLLLIRPTELGLNIQSRYLTTPRAGDLLIFNQSKVKEDGIDWAKKKDLSRLQETYMKIKINNVELIQGVYVKAASNEVFKRRIYKLIHASGKYYQVVHYRLEIDDPKPKGLDENIRLLVYQYLRNERQYQQQFELQNQLNAQSGFNNPFAISESGSGENDFYPSSTMPVNDHQPQHTVETARADIIEFAPKFMISGYSADDLIILIILSINYNEMTPIKVRFVNESNQCQDSMAVFLTPHVVKCIAPPDLYIGIWQLFVMSSENDGVYAISRSVFEVFPSVADEEMDEDDDIPILGKRNHSSPKKPAFAPRNNPHYNQSSIEAAEQFDPERQCKIRFVERLISFRHSTVGAGMDVPMQIDTNVTNRRLLERSSMSSCQWLEDTQLANLSNAELEAAMDEYIAATRRELISIAMTDEETIRVEIDSLDNYGLNLLHYCCINNFLTLIPELLKKGAQINEKTLEGFTPLHLAAAAGHLEVAVLLVEHGADVGALDNEGETVIDAAANNGHETLANRLEEYARLKGHCAPRSNRKGRGSFNLDSGTGSLVDLDSDNAENSRILQEAFSTLSLTDKAALSIAANQSIISETDKVALRHAMLVMGPAELASVDEEVKKIQNNVRGWILRKNYISLREATKTLQSVWREKRAKSVTLNPANGPSQAGTSTAFRPEALTNNRNNNSLRSTYIDSNFPKQNSKTMGFDPDSFINGAEDEDVALLLTLSRFNSNSSAENFVVQDDKTSIGTFTNNAGDGRPGLPKFKSVKVGKDQKNPFDADDEDNGVGKPNESKGIGFRAMSVEENNSYGNPKDVSNEEQERAAVKLQTLFRKIKVSPPKTSAYRNAMKQMHASTIIQRSMKRWISHSRGVGSQTPPPTSFQHSQPTAAAPPQSRSFPSSYAPATRPLNYPPQHPQAQYSTFNQVYLPNGSLPNPPMYIGGRPDMQRLDSNQSELFDEILAIPDEPPYPPNYSK